MASLLRKLRRTVVAPPLGIDFWDDPLAEYRAGEPPGVMTVTAGPNSPPTHAPCMRCGEPVPAACGFCTSCSVDIDREAMWAEMGISDLDASNLVEVSRG